MSDDESIEEEELDEEELDEDELDEDELDEDGVRATTSSPTTTTTDDDEDDVATPARPSSDDDDDEDDDDVEADLDAILKDRIAAGDDEDDDEDDDEQAVAKSQRSLPVTPSQSRHGRRTSSPARTASCWLTRPRWSMVSVHTAVGWSESTMNDDDDVTEKLLDALVYAPLGLALEAKDLLPKLAERVAARWPHSLGRHGRRRRGQSEAVKLVDELRTGVEAFFAANSDEETPDTAESEPGPDTELPIEGYATLTAVEVIPLLSDLDDEQLDTIEAFEKANRNRSTVLNRIRQRRS